MHRSLLTRTELRSWHGEAIRYDGETSGNCDDGAGAGMAALAWLRGRDTKRRSVPPTGYSDGIVASAT